jgi:hypothetical protein
MCVLLSKAPLASTDLITIRFYNTFGLTRHAVAEARSVADAVLKAAGIDASWRECRTPRYEATDPCNNVLRQDEVVVRVVRDPAGLETSPALGDSFVDASTGIGVLATVFADRVLAAGSRTGANPIVLLGRAVAHEVGHLLIGTPTHSARGLMRAQWSDDELRSNRDRDWVFSRSQALRMQNRLVTRARRVNP